MICLWVQSERTVSVRSNSVQDRSNPGQRARLRYGSTPDDQATSSPRGPIRKRPVKPPSTLVSSVGRSSVSKDIASQWRTAVTTRDSINSNAEGAYGLSGKTP